MDIGNIWNSLYMSQLMGTQMYGLQTDPFQSTSYADAWQENPWQYGLQTGGLYGNSMLQTWQNAEFMDTLNGALTKYNESLRNPDSMQVGEDVDVSTHEGNVWQLGYDKSLVYLPGEQKLMIVQTTGAGQNEKNTAAGDERATGYDRAGKADRTTGRSKTTGLSQKAGADEKGILVDQRKARASAAYRRTQRAGQSDSLWAKNKAGT